MSQYDPNMSEEDRLLIKRLCERQDRMKTKRMQWESHWQEAMRYIIPRKEDINTTRMEGDKRGNDLYDTTAIMANQLLAGALHGMLTNPATRFFDLIMGDPELDAMEEVLAWLDTVGERMYIVMNNTNFQTEVHEIYVDEGAIGTACLFMGEHKDRVVHFSARAMKEIFIEENNLGIIDIVHRKFKWKPRQIVQEFGLENLPEWVKEQYNKGCDEEWDIIHVVEPGDEDYKSKMKKNFSSTYILEEKKIILQKDKGFREFPYAVPRWTKTSGETYGRGPGMDMLADIKMINEMAKTTLQGAQMTVHPPMQVDDDGVIGSVRLIPQGITLIRPGSEGIKPIITNARIDFGYQAMEDVRKHIRAGFYVDQLQLNDGPQMTATEVTQRTEEKLRLMGPVLGRQHFEFLRPVVERVFGLMERAGMIPEPPDAIKGKQFDVRYSSLIARVQRTNEGQDFQRAIQAVAPLIQLDPNVIDNLDMDKAFRYELGVYGVTQKIMRDSKGIKDIRAAKEKAAAMAAQQAQEAHQAETVNKVLPGTAQMMNAAQKGQQ